MLNIFIKSYNRAFYLDRCIKSIKKFVSGTYSITILDDGTPKKYLDKIQKIYPEISIKTSANYEQKSQSVEENIRSGKDIDSFNIPTDLWYNAVKEASDYVIVTEDDVWFTEPTNVDELQEKANQHQISLIKLGWLGNFQNDKCINISDIDEQLKTTQPKDLFLSSPLIMDWFMYNKFKFFTILYKLKIFDNHTKSKYWALNSILMGFWRKDYWLYVWKDAQGVVDEKQQLRNAAIYYRKHQNNPNFIARLKEEAMKTTFKSSSTNSYHKYGNNFDVNYFNYLMNEAWYNGAFDTQQNFPKDFSTDYFESFFDEKIDKEAFRSWILKFQNQYKNLGCEIE